MNWEAIGAIGELVGGLVVILSIFYLARQIKQNTKQTQLASAQAINSSNDSAFDPIYIPENTQVFTRGQLSYSNLSEEEKILFDMLMTRLVASFDTTTFQHKNGAFDTDLYRGLARFMSSFTSSPGGAEWLETRSESFSDECLMNLRNPDDA